jgi:ABC-type nitrate/sulfonate/bicarbonate transport system substrate-binding protein
LAVIALTAAGCGGDDGGDEGSDEAGSSALPAEHRIPQTSLNFGNAEFIDHTDAILGVEQGWFEDVGITLKPEPAGALYTPADHASVLLSNRVDVQSTNYQILLPALNKTDELRMFAYGDFFIGFALMGDKEFKSFSEFKKEGMEDQAALRAAASQLEGKTLTWSADPAVRGFGRTVFGAAGLSQSDINLESLNDAQGIQLMLADRAEFQIGGAPTRITLEKEGFKPIITAADLTGIVEPPYESSAELAAVSTNGWGTTRKFWEENEDTVMRLASVKWRISQYIAENPDKTAPTHVQQLNRAAGTKLTPEDAKIIYRSIDPYIPFEEQADLWFDPEKPTYELTMIEASINQAEESGTLDKGKVKPEDVTIAHLVYRRAVELKSEADKAMAAVDEALAGASGEQQEGAQQLLTAAREQYEGFNYLDAARLAKAAQEQLSS